ncbi:MAG: DUF4153 domain-containing protein [Acidobacteriota bacterium]
MDLKNWMGELLSGKLQAVRRFYQAILCCILTTGLVIGQIHLNDNEQLLGRLTMTIALAVPIALLLQFLFERYSESSWSFRIIGYVTAAGVLVLCYYMIKNENTEMYIRYAALNLFFYLAFLVAPYFSRREGFPAYCVQITMRGITTILLSIVLYLGLAAILGSIDVLLQVDMAESLYIDAWLIVVGVFAPIFFLSGVPTNSQEIEPGEYPKAFRILMFYIIMPLIVLYTMLLYAYFGKILITFEWPNGVVGNLVLWYSIITTITVFLISSLMVESAWVRNFSKWIPRAIIPLIILMFVSVGMRVNIYGITESRYQVLAAGSWVLGIMLYLNISKRVRYPAFVASIAVIILVSSFGPLSCFSMSIFSQNYRLEAILNKYDMIDSNGLVRPNFSDVSVEDQIKMSTIIAYFSENHSFDDVTCLPQDFTLAKMPEAFGFEYRWPNKWEWNRNSDSGDRYSNNRNYYWSCYFSSQGVIKVGEYDYLVNISNWKESFNLENRLNVDMDLQKDSNIRVISGSKVLCTFDLNEFSRKYPDELAEYNSSVKPEAEKCLLVQDNQFIAAKLIPYSLNGKVANGKRKVDEFSGCLLIRVKK